MELQRPLLLGGLAAELASTIPTDMRLHASPPDECRAETLFRARSRAFSRSDRQCCSGQLDQRGRWAGDVIELSMQHQPAVTSGSPPTTISPKPLSNGQSSPSHAELATARRLIEAVPSDRLHSQLLGFESALSLALPHRDAERRMVKSQELHRRGRRYDSESLMLANDLALAMDVGGLENLFPSLSRLPAKAVRPCRLRGRRLAMLEIGRTISHWSSSTPSRIQWVRRRLHGRVLHDGRGALHVLVGSPTRRRRLRRRLALFSGDGRQPERPALHGPGRLGVGSRSGDKRERHHAAPPSIDA